MVRDREALVAALRERGVDWLAPSDAAGTPMTDETLIASLAANEDARLRQALIGLFLLHPALAPLVLKLRPALDAAEIDLIAHYTAAVYLQRMWRVRLGHYLPPFADLPDYFSKELSLPAPEEEYGKVGLHALAAWHAEHSAQRANHLSEYKGVAALLFERLKSKAGHSAIYAHRAVRGAGDAPPRAAA